MMIMLMMIILDDDDGDNDDDADEGFVGRENLFQHSKNARKPKENNNFLSSGGRAQHRMSKTQRFLILLGEVNFRIVLKSLPLSRRLLTFLAHVKINGRCSKNARSKK